MNKIYKKHCREFDLSTVVIKYVCPNCKNEFSYTADKLAEIGDPFCSKCEHELHSTEGKAYFESTSSEIIDILRNIQMKVVKNYKSDFIRDEGEFRNYSGRFIWGCRENGTDLVLLHDKNYTVSHDLINWVVGNGRDKRSEEIRYFDGKELHKVSTDEAKQIWNIYMENV